MAEYRSSHSGPTIDDAVDRVINGTSGIQGFKFLGQEIEKGSDNKVDLSWDNFATKGLWDPSLGATNSTGLGRSPDCTYVYKHGQYVKIGHLCYISFEAKLYINTVYDPYACIVGLPYYADKLPGAPGNEYEYSLAVGEFSQEHNNLDLTPQITMIIRVGNNHIELEHKNGIHSIELVADSDSVVWIRGSGLYLT